MARGPNGEWRPADVIGNAVHIGRIATREIEDSKTPPARRKAGIEGARSRAANTSAERRSEIAKNAAAARWTGGEANAADH